MWCYIGLDGSEERLSLKAEKEGTYSRELSGLAVSRIAWWPAMV